MAGKSKPVTIVADRPLETWEQFYLDSIQQLNKALGDADAEVRSQVVISKLSNGSLACGWENTNSSDLVDMAASLFFDAVEMFVEEFIETNYGVVLGDDAAEGEDPEC